MWKRHEKTQAAAPQHQLTSSNSDNDDDDNLEESQKKKTQWPWSSLGRRQPSRVAHRRVVGRRYATGKKKKSREAAEHVLASTDESKEQRYDGPELPAVVYIAHVFPCLDRQSQDALAAASRDVFLARPRLAACHSSTIMTWPSGCIQMGRPVVSLTFSQDEQTLIVSSCRKQVHVFDKIQGEIKPKFITGHKCPVVAATYSPDGTMLATAGRSDGMIRLFHYHRHATSRDETRLSVHSCFRMLHVHHCNLQYICWSPTNDMICSWGGNGILCVSNVSNGQMSSIRWKTRLEVSGGKETVAFSPNGHELAFAQNNEVVKLWNFNSNAVRTLRHSNDETRSYLGDFITSLAYSPNGQYLAVASHVATIKLWRLVPVYNDDDNNEDYAFRHYYDYKQKIHLGPGWSAVMHIQFTPDSSYIACSNHGSQIRLVHLEMGAVVASLLGHTGRIEALSFTNNGRTLASGSCDRTVRLWNMSAYYLNHV